MGGGDEAEWKKRRVGREGRVTTNENFRWRGRNGRGGEGEDERGIFSGGVLTLRGAWLPQGAQGRIVFQLRRPRQASLSDSARYKGG